MRSIYRGPGFSGKMCNKNRVPTWTGKPGNLGRHFPVGEKSEEITQNIGEVREFLTNVIYYF